jgi:hypothetical protein
MTSLWKACFAAGYAVLSGTLVAIGWATGCPICGKHFIRKISGHASPCHTCNHRLLDAQENLEAFELGKSEGHSKKFVSDQGA